MTISILCKHSRSLLFKSVALKVDLLQHLLVDFLDLGRFESFCFLDDANVAKVGLGHFHLGCRIRASLSFAWLRDRRLDLSLAGI